MKNESTFSIRLNNEASQFCQSKSFAYLCTISFIKYNNHDKEILDIVLDDNTLHQCIGSKPRWKVGN